MAADSDYPFNVDARRLYRHAAADEKRLVIVHDFGHRTDLVDATNSLAPRVRRLIAMFIFDHAGG